MTARRRILIVDDERLIARALERRLISLGFDVVGLVGTGEEAIQLAGAERPDLILMDIRLQGAIDGTVAAERITAHHRIPIVFLTAYADDETLRAARVSEPFGYILKPYDERELKIVIEIALYKHAAEQERERLQKLEALGQLAGGIAHDFNNVLTVILTNCSTLLSQLAPTDRSRPQLEMIRSVSERASRMTRQLLTFGRNEVRTLAIVDPGMVLTNVAGMLAHLVGSDVTLVTHIEPALHPVAASSSDIERVILNLVANAREAVFEGGTVRVELANEDDAVRLAVTDSGRGMDEAARARVFEAYFTASPGHHSGLGLPAVYAIVKACGATVDVTSSVGEGTTFAIRFPIATGTPAKPSLAADARLRGTVVVVEDNDDVRSVVRDTLIAAGLRVIEARDGIDALGVYVAHGKTIDLVISDLEMPRMSGAELTERLRAIKPDAKILYISGYADSLIAPTDTDQAILHKPFTPTELLDRVRGALAS